MLPKERRNAKPTSKFKGLSANNTECPTMANPDLNALLNSLLPFAQKMLAAHGEFYPFGSSMTPSGEIVAISVYDGDENPPSQKVIDLMTKSFREQATARQLRAVGICYDVRTIPPGQVEMSDAICAALEHDSGESVAVYLPYRRSASTGIEFGQVFATRRACQIFGRAAAEERDMKKSPG